jgi:hypothetical protein
MNAHPDSIAPASPAAPCASQWPGVAKAAPTTDPGKRVVSNRRKCHRNRKRPLSVTTASAARATSKDALVSKGLTDATRTRNHLLKLQSERISLNTVALATNLSRVILRNIRSGKQTRVRAGTERLILAVSKEVIPDCVLVDAKPTWELINELLEEEFTPDLIARKLGFSSGRIEVSRCKVSVRMANAVRQLHNKLTT